MQIVWIERQLLAEQNAANCPVAQQLQTRNTVKIKWTGNIVDWVELIYSLHASGHVNNGKVSLKKLFAVMGEAFGFKVEEFSRVFIDIKNRVKGDRTAFLEELKQALIRIMEKADRKPSRK
jgi:hypothetical protein